VPRPRLLLLGALAGALVAWNWLRLEETTNVAQAALVVALALVPALVRSARAKAAAALAAFLVAAGSAFTVGPGPHFFGRVLSRFGGGFLDFYDVQVPFDPSSHARMHGVLLVAVFAFTLFVVLAAAAGRQGLAALGLLVGAGWPATLLPGHDFLRGSALLVGVLALLVMLRPGRLRRLAVAGVAAGVVVASAVAASSSPALAKHAFLNWQSWDFYTRAARPVNVGYVWNSRYGGLTFPRKRTTLLKIKASPEPLYWRATVLDTVSSGRWLEETAAQVREDSPLGEPDLIPPREERRAGWLKERVTVEGLSDHHLAGGSIPVEFRVPSELGIVSYDPIGIAYANEAPSRGDTYDVWSYVPKPTPAELAASPPIYPELITQEPRYLELENGAFAPPFRKPGRAKKIEYYFKGGPDGYARSFLLRPYRPLYLKAQEVAGGARSPYAAAVALERWFRLGGGFVYDQHPRRPPPGIPPLVDFVVNTQSGYCQHFAGAMALMLRYLGIPSRVAAGFTSGHYDRKSGEWTVTDRNAHMWVEVWFRDWGWVPFDPTPSRGGLAGAYSASSPSFDAAAAAIVLAGKEGLNGFGKELADKLGFGGKPRVSPDVPDLGAPKLTLSRHHSRAPGLLGLLLLVLLGLAALVASIKLAVRASRYLTRDPRRLASACRQELRAFLLDQQVDVPASSTLRELADLVEAEFGVRASAFGRYATAARFGPPASGREAARDARRELRDLRRRLRAQLTRLERFRGLVSLRSLGLSP
jgi:protein-glutamine gamma-glutamyltransferase